MTTTDMDIIIQLTYDASGIGFYEKAEALRYLLAITSPYRNNPNCEPYAIDSRSPNYMKMTDDGRYKIIEGILLNHKMLDGNQKDSCIRELLSLAMPFWDVDDVYKMVHEDRIKLVDEYRKVCQ